MCAKPAVDFSSVPVYPEGARETPHARPCPDVDGEPFRGEVKAKMMDAEAAPQLTEYDRAPSPPPPYVNGDGSPYAHQPSIPFVVGASMTPQPAGQGTVPPLATTSSNEVASSLPAQPPPPPPHRIQAYARLEFQEGVDFYIRSLSVIIGRRPPPSPASMLAVNAPPVKNELTPQPAIERSPLLRPVSAARSTSPIEDEAKREPSVGESNAAPSIQVDVDLGPIKAVSREHARLYYDYQTSGWAVEVRGRNGVVVDGMWYARGERVPMQHGTRIQIAERIFHFMLPASSLQQQAASAAARAAKLEEAQGSTSGFDSSDDDDDDSVGHAAMVPAQPGARGRVPAAKKTAKATAAAKGRAAKKPKAKAKAPPKAKKAVTTKAKGRGIKSEGSMMPEDPYEAEKPLVMPTNEHAGKPEKPPYTMTSLVAQAISLAPDQRAATPYVARWIVAAYPFYTKDRSLSGEIEKRLHDARFFIPTTEGTYTVISDPNQVQYFDGTVFRKRAAALVTAAQPAAKSASPAPPAPLPSTSARAISPPVPPPRDETSVGAPSMSPSVSTSVPVASTSQISTPAPTTSNVASAPLPIVIEPLPAGYDPAKAPAVAGLAEPPIAIHDGKLVLSPAVFKHLHKDAAKLAALRAMPTDKAMGALRQFLVAFLKAKAEKKRKADAAAVAGTGTGSAEGVAGAEPAAKVAKVE